jgi:CheY-like chemotaxis protein
MRRIVGAMSIDLRRGHDADPLEPLSVLVAEDDDDLRALVVQMLEAGGCSTRSARDGGEVIALLDEALDEPSLRPDVLVTDIRMPKLSGLGILHALKRARWSLPVVVMTAVNDESIEVVAMRLGAVGILHKPFDMDDLMTAVQNARVVQGRRSHVPPA